MRWYLLVLIAACSKTPRTADVSLDSLVPGRAASVLRSSPEFFPIAQVLRTTLAKDSTCWHDLEGHLVAGYQIMFIPRTSLFILEGDLPASEVEDCVAATVPGSDLKIAHDHDLVKFELRGLGTAWAAWRGRYIVVGAEPLVREAIDHVGSGSSSPWTAPLARIAKLANNPEMAMVTTEPIFGVLLGIESTGWELQLDHMDRSAGAPKHVSGKMTVYAKTSADATAGAQHLATGDLHFVVPLPETLLAALRKMKTEVHGDHLEIAFDDSMFLGMDMAELGKLYDQLKAMVPAKSP